MSELNIDWVAQADRLGIQTDGRMVPATSFRNADFEIGGVTVPVRGAGEDVVGNRLHRFGDAHRTINWRETSKNPNGDLIVDYTNADIIPRVVYLQDGGLHLYPEQVLLSTRRVAPLLGKLVTDQEGSVRILSPVAEGLSQSYVRGKAAPRSMKQSLAKGVTAQAMLWQRMQQSQEVIDTNPLAGLLSLEKEVKKGLWPELVIYSGDVSTLPPEALDIFKSIISKSKSLLVANQIKTLDFLGRSGVIAIGDSEHQERIFTDNTARTTMAERIAEKAGTDLLAIKAISPRKVSFI